MGFNTTVTALHENIALALNKHKGKQLKTAEIVAAYVEKFPDDTSAFSWVKPPDHSINTKNDGDCDLCAGTEKAIFKKIRHGLYKVL